jgi:hypothetical protein
LILLKNPSDQKVTVKKTISDVSPGNSNRVQTKLARKNSRHFSCIFTHLQKGGVLQQNHYYDGVYFQPTTAGAYAVVAPPVSVIVPQVPNGAEAIVVGPTTYYFAGGAFYLQQPTGFAVVPAPLGVTVTGLPPGAAPVTLNGAIYYTTGSAYFRPVMQAGVTVYVTARP